MFKIESLLLESETGQRYEYLFSTGLNYVEGLNDTGKTLFADFLDFMLGADNRDKFVNAPFLQGTLRKAVLALEYDGRLLSLTRYIDSESVGASINGVPLPIQSVESYRAAINDFLYPRSEQVESMPVFTDAELTFRTFTLFSFLDEDAVGWLDGFYSKLRELKYRIKARGIFDFLFNPNPALLKETENRIAGLSEEIRLLESQESKEQSLLDSVNRELVALGLHEHFTGANSAAIQKAIDAFDRGALGQRGPTEGDLASRMRLADELAGEIRAQRAMLLEMDKVEAYNRKRASLLVKLGEIAGESEEYANVVSSAERLLRDLEPIASHSEAVIQREILQKKAKRLQNLRRSIETTRAELEPLEYVEKQRAIALIQACMSQYADDGAAKRLAEAKAELQQKRREASELRARVDESAIGRLSSNITGLYLSAESVSSFVREDASFGGFHIAFIKDGVSLRPRFRADEVPTDYFTGSRARHALMQMCGYLAFMVFLIERGDCPITPILVFDHPSSPFDDINCKAIGAVINRFYEVVDREFVQIFLLEPRNPESLGLRPDNLIHLQDGDKTGFNPFWSPES